MAINQLKAGAFLNYVILGLNAITGLAYTPFMLRMLGQNEYGIYSLAASVIAYLSILDFGFGNAVIRYTAKLKAENKTNEQYSLFGMFTILYTIIGIITFIAGLALYNNIGTMFGETFSPSEIERTKTIVLLMLFNLAFSFPLSIYGAIITAYENFVFLRLMQIARILLSTTVMICILSMGYKAVAMVVVQTIFNFTILGINYFYCKRKINIKIRFEKINWKLLKEISIYSFWIFLNVIMDKIYWSTGQFILGIKIGAEEVAIFSLAITLTMIYMGFSTAISGVFLPRVTAMVAQNKSDEEISELFIRTGRIQFIIISFILTIFTIFGQQFIIYWAGENYSNSYYIILVFFFALSIPLIQNLGITILQARNQMKFRSTLYICIAIVSLIFQIVLVNKYQSIGCAFAIGGALLLGQGLIMNIYYQKVQNLNILKFWKEICKMAIFPTIITIGGVCTAKYMVINNLPILILYIFIYAMIYIVGFWRYSMNPYERNLFLNPFITLKQRIINR